MKELLEKLESKIKALGYTCSTDIFIGEDNCGDPWCSIDDIEVMYDKLENKYYISIIKYLSGDRDTPPDVDLIPVGETSNEEEAILLAISAGCKMESDNLSIVRHENERDKFDKELDDELKNYQESIKFKIDNNLYPGLNNSPDKELDGTIWDQTYLD